MTMIKAVIFDCFGVLVNGAFHDVYARLGGYPEKDHAFIEDLLGQANLGFITSDDMRDQVTLQLGITDRQWQDAINSTQLPSEPLLTYAKSLKDRYKIAILSNANVGTLERKFTPAQLLIFDAVIVSAEVHITKPDPAIYALTAEKLGVKPEECVFLDDIPEYCQGAESVGMKSICYKNYVQGKRDLETLLSQSE
jgi:epoxide hydrolase-like predicted phosphatase